MRIRLFPHALRLAAALALLPCLAQEPGIRLVQDLHFGGLQVADRGGMITLTADGTRVPMGSVTPILRPASQEARFQLSGPPGARFHLRLEPRNPVLSGPGGGGIRVESFFASLEGLRGSFDAQGLADLRLGAKLDIPAGAPQGPYAARQVFLEVQIEGDTPRTMRQPFAIHAFLRPVLKLSNGGPLDFASLLPGTTQGIFTVGPDGAHRSVPPGGPRLVRGMPRPAAFTLVGPPGADYSLELPTRILLTGPGAPMEVRDFTCDLPVQGSLPSDTVHFQVGASLVVPPGQPSGLYRGLFRVSVSYQ